jgi:manganese efflux pump family protein
LTEFYTFLLLAIGLSFDSFAVSVSCGIIKKTIRFKQAVIVAFSLGFFQALFPLLGWWIGKTIHTHISGIDHWIAFSLLMIIGIRMIIEGFRKADLIKELDPLKPKVLIGLSVATSMDALAVGLTFGFLEVNILMPLFIIGSVTFLAAMLGMLFGKKISGEKSHRSIVLGGIILVLLGVKILLEHLQVIG